MPQRFLADHAARQRIRLEWRTFASFYCLPLFKGCPFLSFVLLKHRWGMPYLGLAGVPNQCMSVPSHAVSLGVMR